MKGDWMDELVWKKRMTWRMTRRRMTWVEVVWKRMDFSMEI